MRFSINIPNFGDFADAEVVANVAEAAEAAGWDALFIWDHILYDRQARQSLGDPWILLTAAALATERIKLGPLVTPVARRRPEQLARQVSTLDNLSRGRVIFGAGLGGPIEDEYGSFGEPTDPRVRAAMLDEGLEVLTRLWSGETVSFSGRHYRVDEVGFQPTPVQQPRIPIWVAGAWPRRGPLRRAARFDGSAPLKLDDQGELVSLDAEDVRGLLAVVGELRQGDGPFDLLVGGISPEDPVAARDRLAELAEAGVTWWQETVDPRETDLDTFRRRVRQGPPGA